MKAQITGNKINLPKLFLVNWVRVGTSNSLQYLIGFKSNTVKIYSVVQSVKLLLALSIFKVTTLNNLFCCPPTKTCTVLPAKSDSDAMPRSQCYQGHRIYLSLVY